MIQIHTHAGNTYNLYDNDGATRCEWHSCIFNIYDGQHPGGAYTIHDDNVEVVKDSPGGEVRYVDVCGTCGNSCKTDEDGYSICCMDRADHLMWCNGIWRVN